MKIAAATLNQTPLDFENNFQNIKNVISLARNENVDLVCFPELCITGYGCEDMFLSEWVPQKAKEYLQKVVSCTENISVAVGLPYVYGDRLYNTTCLVSNRKILGYYAKRHLANDGIHYEERWFSTWMKRYVVNVDDAPFGDVIFNMNGLKIGFEICEDAWREETRPAHRYLEKNVDLILNPSASHFSFGKWKTRKKLVITSSDKFNCTYVYANLLGNEAGRAIYDGDCYIASKGKLVAQNSRLSFKNFELLINDNIVGDSFITKEEEFTQVESLALFDYWRKSKSNGFVLSLSGGADSSTCAVLVSEMWKRACNELDKEEISEKLHFLKNLPSFKDILSTVYQGTKNSSEDTLNSARELADEIRANFSNWNIDEEVNSYTKKIEKSLREELTWEKHDIALQNIQARSRSPIIWMLANVKNALLLTTSNRSEASVGYATMDGDTSGSISPIAGVDKDFIRKWLIWAEKNLGYTSLKYVNNLNPSAELRPLDRVQEDEKDLMPYDILNRIEQLLIRDKFSLDKVVFITSKEFDTDCTQYVSKFAKMWQRNQWKRERYAPAFHLDDYNVDSRTWIRFPILSGGF